MFICSYSRIHILRLLPLPIFSPDFFPALSKCSKKTGDNLHMSSGSLQSISFSHWAQILTGLHRKNQERACQDPDDVIGVFLVVKSSLVSSHVALVESRFFQERRASRKQLCLPVLGRHSGARGHVASFKIDFK